MYLRINIDSHRLAGRELEIQQLKLALTETKSSQTVLEDRVSALQKANQELCALADMTHAHISKLHIDAGEEPDVAPASALNESQLSHAPLDLSSDPGHASVSPTPRRGSVSARRAREDRRGEPDLSVSSSRSPLPRREFGALPSHSVEREARDKLAASVALTAERDKKLQEAISLSRDREAEVRRARACMQELLTALLTIQSWTRVYSDIPSHNSRETCNSKIQTPLDR